MEITWHTVPPSAYNCRCALKPVPAHALADLAQFLLERKDIVIVSDTEDIAEAKLAMDFERKLSPMKRMRAMVENWSVAQIVEELY